MNLSTSILIILVIFAITLIYFSNDSAINTFGIGYPTALIGGIIITGVFALIAKYISLSYNDISSMFKGGANGKEFEARWIDIDVAKIREKLRELGATVFHEDKLYKRYVYPLSNGYFRVRLEYDNGGNEIVTMTSKTYEDPKFPVETEIEIKSDFNTSKKFLDSINGISKAYHETRREKWTGIGGCNEVCIDTLPGLNPYVEIDCSSEEKMKEIADKLGLNMADAKYGAYVGVFYDEYGIDKKWFNDTLDELKFDTVAEKLSPMITKNKDKFDSIVDSYKL